jgi:hypothetical protein
MSSLSKITELTENANECRHECQNQKKERKLKISFCDFSPSGCTFWGKKPWSRKKKILWQLGTLVGAPVGIALVAGITVPAMIIGACVDADRFIYRQLPISRSRYSSLGR